MKLCTVFRTLLLATVPFFGVLPASSAAETPPPADVIIHNAKVITVNSTFAIGQAVGQRTSWRRLPSSDFREHRLYMPGDDLRHVDWNASARSEHIFVKLGERPREVTIHVLLDNSASMDFGITAN